MALKPQTAPRDEEDERIAVLSQEVALDPPFVERLTNPIDHGAYLEHAHESTARTLAVVHMRLSRGETDAALELVIKLRKHLDTLWDQRVAAAERQVAP